MQHAALYNALQATASTQTEDRIPTLYVGFDRGQDTTTATHSDFDGNRTEIFMSSMVGTYNPDDFRDIAAGTNYSASGNGIPGIIDLQFDDEHYIVGDSAREYASHANTNIGNRNRYHELPQKISMMAVCALLLSKAHPDRYEANIKLVSGMPIQTYTETKAELVKTELGGDYTFVLCGQSYTLHVEVIDVKIEGSGAVYIMRDQTDGDYIIIDGGSFNTTALYARRSFINPRKSAMLEIGVDEIKKRMAGFLRRKIGRVLEEEETHKILYGYANVMKYGGRPLEVDLLNREKFAEEEKELMERIITYRGHIFREMPKLYGVINGKRTRISPMDMYAAMRRAVKSVGSDIRDFLTKLYGDAQGNVALGVSSVKYIGGASYYLQYEIEELMGEVTIPQEAERVNARGYAARAVAIMKKRSLEKGE